MIWTGAYDSYPDPVRMAVLAKCHRCQTTVRWRMAFPEGMGKKRRQMNAICLAVSRGPEEESETGVGVGAPPHYICGVISHETI